MQIRIKWLDHTGFVGESSGGHSVVIGGAPEHGGRNPGTRPRQMILFGGCACFDIVTILQTSCLGIKDCIIEISAQRADEVPAVFTSIHLRYIVTEALQSPCMDFAERAG